MDAKTVKFNGRRMMFLFDTNIYRNIARMIQDNQFISNKFIIDEMNILERKKNCNSILSLTTSQELLIHLADEKSMSYNECYNALRFQFFHTHIFQMPKRIASIDSLLSFFFYGTDTRENRLRFSEFIIQTLEKIFYQNVEISTLKPTIEDIKKDFACYKLEFYKLFELLLDYYDNNNNGLDSHKIHEGLHKYIKNDNYIDYITDYLIERTKHFCSDSINNEISEEKVKEFNIYFKEALIQFKYFFELLRDNRNCLKKLEENEKWNAIIDFHLVFEWCFLKWYNRNKDVEIILVTEDRKNNFKNFYELNEDAWDMWQYFDYLGFIIDKTNPLKNILKSSNEYN